MKETIKHNLIPALLALLVFAPIAWVAADRTPPYEALSGVTVPEKISRGQPYKIAWKLQPNPNVKCPGTVYLFLVDSAGTIYIIPPRPSSFGLLPITSGPTVIFGSEHNLDPNAALGPAKIYVTLELVCNFSQWLWPLELKHKPVDTEIIK